MVEKPPPLGVVMVSASFHPHVGGAEKQALELSAALKARGVSVRVATRRLAGLPAREELRGVRVDRLWCAGSGFFNAASFLLSLTRYLWAQAPFYEAIHVHLGGSPALAAALAGRLLGKRVFVKLGGGAGIGEVALSSRSFAGRLKLRLLSWLAPQFLAVAPDIEAEARRWLGNAAIHSVPNGVDVARYRPGGDKSALRAALGWPRGLGLLYVGRFSPEKRLPRFLEIWADLSKKLREPGFLAFIGEGIEESLIRDAAERERVSQRVFIRGPLDAIEQAYQAADLFILPSVSEGLSNALLEAQACGLAALASRVGATPLVVEDGRTGFLFAPGDEEALKGQLRKLLERPELCVELGRSARRAIVEKYSIDKIAERCETLYRWSLP